jgi:hypothetical protein
MEREIVREPSRPISRHPDSSRKIRHPAFQIRTLSPKLRQYQSVPVLILDVDENEANKILATLDPLAGMAEADEVAARELADMLQTASSDVRDLLDSMAGRPAIAVVQDEVPDKSAELQKKWGTKLGRVWEIGPHRLACGDSQEAATYDALMAEKECQLIATSPPYTEVVPVI